MDIRSSFFAKKWNYFAVFITGFLLFPFLSSISRTPPSAISIDQRTIDHYKAKAAARSKMFVGEALHFHNLITTEALCTNLWRIGNVGDGGKYICGPQFISDWKRPCVMYSFGIKGDPSFEEEFNTVTNGDCSIVAVDMKGVPNAIERLQNIGATFIETAISNETSANSMTITDLMARQNHEYVDILKMDIEGSEYSVADELFSHNICQIMVELHTGVRQYGKFVNFLRKASSYGYYLIHHEVNILYLHGLEVTLLHETCFDRFGSVTPLARFLNV